jgi:nucleotide-binding universal stress UspA family protein
MKKVLVPTDFSDNAYDALMYAFRLYDDIPCLFYILNTYQVRPSRIANKMNRERDTHIYRVLKEESESQLNKLKKHLDEHLLNDKHEYNYISKSGNFLDIMKGLVSQENIDMIVMGTTGATGAKEIFMGSNTIKAIKNIDLCPIISVPEKYEYEEPEQVAFATDLKRHFNIIELNCLRELQLIHNFKIRVIHVKEEYVLDSVQQQNVEALKQYFEIDSISFEEILTDTKVAEAINDFVIDQKINMVCLVNYEHSFIEKLINEPIIKKMSFHSAVPLLVLPV